VRITFAEFQTFDSMRTPKPGERRQAPKSLADIDLSAVQREMAETIEKVKSEDPKHLKAEILRLEKELKKRPEVDAPAAEPIEVQVPVFPDELRRDLDAIFTRLTKHGNQIGEIHANLGQTFEQLKFNHEDIRSLVDKYKDFPSSVVTSSPRSNVLPGSVKSSSAIKSPQSVKSQPVVTNGDFPSDLGKAEKQILRAFFWTKDEDATPAKIGFYSDYSNSSGSFKNACSVLRSRGLLSGWKITPYGATVAETFAEEKPSGLELREWLRPKIDKCANEILDVLIEAGGSRMSPDDIASSTPTQYSPSSGSFKNSLARLRSLEAAEGYASDGVKAADVFFE
jgi:hypothetical protein